MTAVSDLELILECSYRRCFGEDCLKKIVQNKIVLEETREDFKRNVEIYVNEVIKIFHSAKLCWKCEEFFLQTEGIPAYGKECTENNKPSLAEV